MNSPKTIQPESYYSHHVDLTLQQYKILHFHLELAKRNVGKVLANHKKNNLDGTGLANEIAEIDELLNLFTISLEKV